MKKALEQDKSLIFFIIAAMFALCFCVVTVDVMSARAIEYHPKIVREETTAIAQAFDIPIIELCDEEAEERIAKLREEKVVSAKARASYVSQKESHTDTSNRYYLAAAICQEVGGYGDHLKMLVGNVIMNRVASPHFPNSIYGVLTQKHQYGMMWKYGIRFPSWATNDIKESCYRVADRLLSGERVCPANVVFQAEFVQGSGVYHAESGVYFCYE